MILESPSLRVKPDDCALMAQAKDELRTFLLINENTAFFLCECCKATRFFLGGSIAYTRGFDWSKQDQPGKADDL